MKTPLNFVFLILIILIYSCVQKGKMNSNKSIDNFKTETKVNSSFDKNGDSIRQAKVMKEAFVIVKQNLSKDYFKFSFETTPDDSSQTITTEINIGHLFTKYEKHLLIRRKTPWGALLDLFLIRNDSLISLISHEQGDMTYIADTIFDANGDGFKDFVVNWEPSSGCCRRDTYSVYLFLPQKETFTSDYTFINPTFFQKEKIIRGVEYGHPGEVGLYKYKWNGLKVDTIEFIYPDENHKGFYIKTKKPSYRPTEKQGVLLKNIPKEYLGIESFDWFINEE